MGIKPKLEKKARAWCPNPYTFVVKKKVQLISMLISFVDADEFEVSVLWPICGSIVSVSAAPIICLFQLGVFRSGHRTKA